MASVAAARSPRRRRPPRPLVEFWDRAKVGPEVPMCLQSVRQSSTRLAEAAGGDVLLAASGDVLERERQAQQQAEDDGVREKGLSGAQLGEGLAHLDLPRQQAGGGLRQHGRQGPAKAVG